MSSARSKNDLYDPLAADSSRAPHEERLITVGPWSNRGGSRWRELKQGGWCSNKSGLMNMLEAQYTLVSIINPLPGAAMCYINLKRRLVGIFYSIYVWCIYIIHVLYLRVYLLQFGNT